MENVRQWIQERVYVLLMLMLASGFLILLAELLMTRHTDGIQLVAVAASLLGLILIVGALVVQTKATTLIAILLLALSVTGVIGAYEHYEEGSKNEVREAIHIVNQSGNQAVAFAQEDEENEADEDGDDRANEGAELYRDEEEGETPPPLAPLSLAGLSVMGAVIMLGVPRREI